MKLVSNPNDDLGSKETQHSLNFRESIVLISENFLYQLICRSPQTSFFCVYVTNSVIGIKQIWNITKDKNEEIEINENNEKYREVVNVKQVRFRSEYSAVDKREVSLGQEKLIVKIC